LKYAIGQGKEKKDNSLLVLATGEELGAQQQILEKEITDQDLL